jgi:hypothetical protein
MAGRKMVRIERKNQNSGRVANFAAEEEEN